MITGLLNETEGAGMVKWGTNEEKAGGLLFLLLPILSGIAVMVLLPLLFVRPVLFATAAGLLLAAGF